MNTNVRRTIVQIFIAGFALLTLAMPSETCAQFTGDNQTNIISGATNNWVGDYHVGSNYVFDALIVQNAGVLTNSGSGYIGYNTGANSNSVTVSGNGSAWRNQFSLYIGNQGVGNSLVISNGGKMFNNGGNGCLGNSSASSNNSVLVTGSGSVWSNSAVQVGAFFSDANSLVISNGGVVASSSSCFIGSANNNSVLVTGSGSVWKAGALEIGINSGTDNMLTIANGGMVFDGTSTVGSWSTTSNNTVLVTGVGSLWSTSNRFELGGAGAANNLVISNGGKVVNLGSDGGSGLFNAAIVGFNSGASNNTALVTGNGSLWSIISSLTIGNVSIGNTLTITNGGSVTASNAYVGFDSGALSNQIIVAGGSLRVTNAAGSGTLQIGSSGAGNSMMISDGGAVFDATSYIGNNSGADSNSVVVSGGGSIWSNSADLLVGYSSSGNSLLITNGASVFSVDGNIGNGFSSASNNAAVVTGNGSVWSNSYQVNIGLGARNSLVISDGGKVFAPGGGAVGNNFTRGNDNRVLVTGSGSEWNTLNTNGTTTWLEIGNSGARNSLVISNGGTVVNWNGEIGGGGAANSNSVLVTDSGSVWSNYNTLSVGTSGSGNSLVISNGGTVFSAGGNGSVGVNSGASNNTALVTGIGSVWTNSGAQWVGDGGTSNSMTISSGGAVFSTSGHVGGSFGGKNNNALVTGNGSVWKIQSNLGQFPLYVGENGAGNALTISNGGAMFDGRGLVGYTGVGISNNSVLVTGLGSIWNNRFEAFVGFDGDNNALTITNGGSVVASNMYVGYVSGGIANRILVSGGNLCVTNTPGNTVLDVRRGTLTFNGGTITTDNLLLTNGSSSVIAFNSGLLNTKGTAVTNTQQFVVGDGVASANFHLLGGVHSFKNGSRIRTNSFLTGCGTVNGSVIIDSGGAVHANCTNLVFTGNVTNNGAMVADGAVLETFGTFVNNGKLFLLNGGATNFHGAFINNGAISNGDIHLAIEGDGSGGLFIRFTGAPDVTYRLQSAVNLTGTWTDLATNTAPASGFIECHETSPLPGQAFYRAAQP